MEPSRSNRNLLYAIFRPFQWAGCFRGKLAAPVKPC